MLDVVRDLMVALDHVVLVYFVVIVACYALLTVLSWFEARRYLRQVVHSRLRRSMRSHLTPPISVCVPCYNEESVIVDSVRCLITLQYPEHEVVLANDGSTDGTLERLIEAFELQRVDQPFEEHRVPSQPVRGIWRSPLHPNLIVVDKENGGRADALNGAIKAARYPLLCCVDADSLLEPSALLTAVRPFVEQPELTVAAGGIIRVANGCEVRSGHVVDVALPDRPLPMFQTVEYLRAFTASRTGWSRMNSLLIISGAFGIFRRDVVIDLGGFAPDSIGEDFELCVRIHQRMRDLGRPYRMAFVPGPVCWTEGPETLTDLGGQRDRWHRGLTDTLWRHRRMIFAPRYGSVGLVGLPFFTLFEFGGAFIEMAGYISVTLSLALGIVNEEFAILFYTLALLSGLFLSLSALLLEDVAFRTFTRWRDFLRLVAYSLFENFGYRQAITFYRVRGFFKYVRGDGSWGEIERRGYADEYLQPQVGGR